MTYYGEKAPRGTSCPPYKDVRRSFKVLSTLHILFQKTLRMLFSFVLREQINLHIKQQKKLSYLNLQALFYDS
jgi:hypothetical protein